MWGGLFFGKNSEKTEITYSSVIFWKTNSSYYIVAYSLVQTSIIETILGNDDKGTNDDDDIRSPCNPTYKTTPCRRKVESSWALSGVWVSLLIGVGHCRPFSCVGSDGSACALVEAGLVQSQSQLR
jgi:hypothetical protein